jgi:GH15 family glucan-1,4-alpha-glucosidase
VLETTISSGDNSYRVTDFAPRFVQMDRYYRPRMVIRKIEPLRGLPRVKVVCKPKGNYGQKSLETETGSNHIRYNGLEESLRLTTNISLSYILEDKEFILRDTFYMVLTYGVPLEGPIRETSETFLNKTSAYWQRWVKSTSIGNLYQSQVIRSALTLKICQYEDTGAIIAAPTSSLPESPGSTRNWDYRFCWMRDTYYTLQAFNSVGHFEEMEKYFSFITNLPVPDGKIIQPLYGITGDSKLTEIEHDLPGYLGNVPVRSGNDAYTHVQNDVYGQILMAVLPLYIDNRFKDHQSAMSLELVETLIKKIELTIDKTDAGIWEFRNRSQTHAYSNLFQWAGSKAAQMVATKMGSDELVKRATALADRAQAHIESAYLKDRKAYGAAVEYGYMDASTLQLIIMGYIPHDSEAAKHHLEALEKELKVNDGLFYRYRVEDDFGEPDSTFLICGFWYAEALACVGRIDDARKAFEELVSYSNSLGLLSEDVDSKDGSMWGNFPQAYSHVGLINAAARINNKLDRPTFLS